MLELIEKVHPDGATGDTLTLPFEQRQKSRQRVRLDSGCEAAVVLPHGTVLDDGDQLRAADGTSVRVRAAAEELSTARTDDPLRFARACYHLGNRHVPLQIGVGWVRYQPDHVLDEMVRGLGLIVGRETAGFDPERGAYHGHSHREATGRDPSARPSDAAHGKHH